MTFVSTRLGDVQAAAVFSKRASGTGEAELLLRHELPLWEVDQTPDGAWLLSRTGGSTTVAGGRDVWGIRVGTDTVAQALVVTDFDEKAIALSPDGRWLAYESDETGRNEIYVRPCPDTEAGKWTVSTTGGVMPRWAHSGQEIFYVNADDEMVVAQIQLGSTPTVSERTVLFEIGADMMFRQTEQYALYDVAPDDSRFVMFRRVGGREASTELILVQNFAEELAERPGN